MKLFEKFIKKIMEMWYPNISDNLRTDILKYMCTKFESNILDIFEEEDGFLE